MISSSDYLISVFKHVDQSLTCQENPTQGLPDPAHMSTAAPACAVIARADNTSPAAAAARGSATTGGRGRAAGNPAPKARSRRKDRPAIDLDTSIQQAQQAAKDAAKALTKARAEARQERKRRARLIRKAGQLSPQDLERIAVLKRTGWWDPATGTPNASAPASGGAQPAATEVSTNPANRAASSSDPRGSDMSGGATAIVGEDGKTAPTTPAAVPDASAAHSTEPLQRDNEDEDDEFEEEDEDASAAKDDDE